MEGVALEEPEPAVRRLAAAEQRDELPVDLLAIVRLSRHQVEGELPSEEGVPATAGKGEDAAGLGEELLDPGLAVMRDGLDRRGQHLARCERREDSQELEQPDHRRMGAHERSGAGRSQREAAHGEPAVGGGGAGRGDHRARTRRQGGEERPVPFDLAAEEDDRERGEQIGIETIDEGRRAAGLGHGADLLLVGGEEPELEPRSVAPRERRAQLLAEEGTGVDDRDPAHRREGRPLPKRWLALTVAAGERPGFRRCGHDLPWPRGSGTPVARGGRPAIRT
ncbi:MAG: hypothetical protein BWX64_02255 [Acidobacteria bacterium ADurb.Bin051]|nr:MAG: hypothetical protein BWX64_02255 [Acidobacteria bacterium ADurb.Bin051]